MAEKEIFNSLSRAVSDDLNDAQDMVSRVMADAFQNLLSKQTFLSPAAPDEQFESLVAGMSVSVDGNILQVNPGTLMQFDVGNATNAPPQSAFNVCTLRAPIDITSLVVANNYYLIEVEPSVVLTGSTTRDVFDPGTQTVVPTLVNKRKDVTVVVTVLSNGTNIPAPSGGNKVPIYAFRQQGFGPVDPEAWDMRPTWEDRDTGKTPFSGNIGQEDGTLIFDQRCMNNNGTFVHTTGLFVQARGITGGRNVARFTAPGFGPDVDQTAGTTPANGDLCNIWLCPVTGNGKLYVPKFKNDNIFQSAGLLIRTDNTTNPGRVGRSNTGSFPSLQSPWANYAVQTNQAMHVASAFASSQGSGAWVPFAQSSGGNTEMVREPSGGNNKQVFDISAAEGVSPASQLVALDGNLSPLNAHIPSNAKSVKLFYLWLATDTVGGGAGRSLDYALEPGRPSSGRNYTMGNTNRTYTWEVEVQVGTGNNDLSEINFTFALPYGGSLANVTTDGMSVTVVGWTI